MCFLVSRHRVIALILAGIAGAVASHVNGEEAAQNTPPAGAPDAVQDAAAPYKSLSDDDLRAEILRRAKVLLAGYESEVVSLMTELGQAPGTYRSLMGRIIGLFSSAQTQLKMDAPELKQIEELRRQHTELLDEAGAAGVLLTQSQQALWDTHQSKKRVINGVPWECMTFNQAAAAKANTIRERQWELLLKMDAIAKAYAEKNYEADIQNVNRHLELRYLEALDYWNSHQTRKKRLQELASAAGGDYEHLLGTRPSAAWARLRHPAFRLPADQIPGMDVKLLAPVQLQLPPKLPWPELPEEFRVLWDGEKMYERYRENMEEAAAADQWMLSHERYHLALKLYDVVWSIGNVFVQPFRDVGEHGKTGNQAILELGKAMTWDMIVGAGHSALTLFNQASQAVQRYEDPNQGFFLDLFKVGSDAATGLVGMTEAGRLEQPKRDDFPATPDGALAYLEALDRYRERMADASEKLKPLNKHWDNAVDTAMHALNLYLAGHTGGALVMKLKGLPAGLKGLLETQDGRSRALVEFQEQLQTRLEASEKAKAILDENPGSVPSEVWKKAEEYTKTQEELVKKADELENIEDAFYDEIYGGKPPPEPPREVQQAIEQRTAEHASDYTRPANPQGPSTFRAANGQVLDAVEHIGAGEFGDVYRLADGSVLKLFKEGAAEHLKDPAANMQREVAGADLAEQAGVHVSNLRNPEGASLSGVLADGTPYLLKELVSQDSILANYLKQNHYNLPAGHQAALLDMVTKLSEGKLFAGDLNINNIYFRDLPGGSVEACLLEGDFIKGKPNMSPHEVLEANLNVLMARGDLTLARGILGNEFPDVPGVAGSAGAFADLIHDRVVGLFKEQHEIRCSFDAMLESSNALARELNALEFDLGGHGAKSSTPADFKIELPKLDEQWEHYGLRPEDGAIENIFELPKPDPSRPVGPEAPLDLQRPKANP